MAVPGFGLLLVAIMLLAMLVARARKRSLAQQNTPHLSIAFDSVGFVVTNLRADSDNQFRLPWLEISRVVAYKRDLFAYDCICLFVARADETGIELDEEMIGWTNFCTVLPQHLPNCLLVEDWLRTVAFPAFATNATELYMRLPVHGA